VLPTCLRPCCDVRFTTRVTQAAFWMRQCHHRARYVPTTPYQGDFAPRYKSCARLDQALGTDATTPPAQMRTGRLEVGTPVH